MILEFPGYIYLQQAVLICSYTSVTIKHNLLHIQFSHTIIFTEVCLSLYFPRLRCAHVPTVRTVAQSMDQMWSRYSTAWQPLEPSSWIGQCWMQPMIPNSRDMLAQAPNCTDTNPMWCRFDQLLCLWNWFLTLTVLASTWVAIIHNGKEEDLPVWALYEM